MLGGGLPRPQLEARYLIRGVSPRTQKPSYQRRPDSPQPVEWPVCGKPVLLHKMHLDFVFDLNIINMNLRN
jgi:hypothetical protein